MVSPRRTVFAGAATLIATLSGEPLLAQSGAEANDWAADCRRRGGQVVITSSNPYCDMSGAPGGAPNLPFGLQPGWLGNILRGDGGAGRHSRANEINSQGVAAARAGDFDRAVTLYRQALRINAQSGIIRLNLMGALLDSAGQFFRNRAPGDTASLDQIERLLDEIDRLDQSSLDGQEGISQIRQYVASGRRAIVTARQEIAQLAANSRQLAAASERIADIANDINRSLERDSPGARNGALGFGDPGGAVPPPPPARPAATTAQNSTPDRPLPGLPRLELMENSPGREAWLRGMDAVARAVGGQPSEWRLALAWFQTAQQRDPTNPALARAVILSQWTLAHRASAASTAAGQATPAGAARQVPVDSDLAFLFDPGAAPASRQSPTSEDLAILFPPSALQPPTDADLQFLFDPVRSSAARAIRQEMDARWEAELLEAVDPGPSAARQDLDARFEAEVLQSFDRNLNRDLVATGEAAKMLEGRTMELQMGLAIAGGGRSGPRLERVARSDVARGLDQDAGRLFAARDYAGAAALENQAHQLDPENPRYRTIRDALRPMLPAAPSAELSAGTRPEAPNN